MGVGFEVPLDLNFAGARLEGSPSYESFIDPSNAGEDHHSVVPPIWMI